MKFVEVDVIVNRFKILYNEVEEKYYILDLNINKMKELKINYDSKRMSRFIRYTYTHNGKRIKYHKTIERIKWELYNEWSNHKRTLIGITEKDCKRVIKDDFDNLGFLTPYSQMKESTNYLMRKIHLFIEKNGGLRYYLKLTDDLKINNKIYYQDHKGNILKSSFEFKFFCILHFNKIEFEYETLKIDNFIPDFIIPKYNLIIEILGLGTRFNYNEKSKEKNKVYGKHNLRYEPINVNGHNPIESIFSRCEDIFGVLKLPDFNNYLLEYSLNGEKFIENLKKYLILVNNGELIIDDELNGNGFIQKYRTYYNYVLENYNSIFHSIKSLIGHPSNFIKRPKNYWGDIENCKYELDEIYKKEKYIPNVHLSQTVFVNIYMLNQFYSKWGIKSIKEGGVFYDYVLTLREKYGYKDLYIEKNVKREQILFNVLDKYHKGEIKLTGKNGILKNYRWIYKFVKSHYGGIFYYIKKNYGYPPPHVQRPIGYYKIEENILYELEENWKIYKKLLNYNEIKGIKGKENTLNSLYSQVGVEQFREGGKYFKFIEDLKYKYGFNDIKSELHSEFDKNIMIYLNGINDGKWNSNTHYCSELGLLQKYFVYITNKYGSLFEGIKQKIGFPQSRVKRYKNYFDDINNCKYEIENHIRIWKFLPSYSQLKKPPFLNNNSLISVYVKYKSKNFEEGGIFYQFTQECIKKYNPT